MQLVRQKHQRDKPDLNMAAMIDVVFLLLIFFLVASAFQQPEQRLPADLPQAGQQATVPDFPPLQLTLTAAGNPRAPQVTCQLGRQQVATDQRLSELLAQRRRIADVPVIVRGIGPVPFQQMVQGVDLARRAGFTTVAFAVNEPTP